MIIILCNWISNLLSKSINEQGGIFRFLRETRISIRIQFGNTADCGILQQFWLKYWWENLGQTPQIILEFFKQFDLNFVWKWSCLFFDQNSSGKNNFWRIMKTFVSPIKKLINCRGGDVIRIFKNQMAVEFLWEFFKNFDQSTSGNL